MPILAQSFKKFAAVVQSKNVLCWLANWTLFQTRLILKTLKLILFIYFHFNIILAFTTLSIDIFHSVILKKVAWISDIIHVFRSVGLRPCCLSDFDDRGNIWWRVIHVEPLMTVVIFDDE